MFDVFAIAQIFSSAGMSTRVALQTAKREKDEKKLRNWFLVFATRLSKFVRDDEQREAHNVLNDEMVSFVTQLGPKQPPGWFLSGGSGPMMALTYGDLDGRSLLLDLKGSPWTLKYSEVQTRALMFDITRFMATILFGYTYRHEIYATHRRGYAIHVRRFCITESTIPPEVRHPLGHDGFVSHFFTLCLCVQALLSRSPWTSLSSFCPCGRCRRSCASSKCTTS